MTPLSLAGVALGIVVTVAGAEAYIIVRQHEALVLERRETAVARRQVDYVQRVRGTEQRQAEDALRTLQASCRDEIVRAAQAGRAIERAVNAPSPPHGRRRIGAGDLRIIAGQDDAEADLPTRPDGRGSPQSADSARGRHSTGR